MQYEFKIVFVYLILINLIEYFAFDKDKDAAISGQWRVPEKALLMLAMCGGTIGAIVGQQTLRHKTQKQPFKLILYSIAAFQIIFLLSLMIPSFRNEILQFLSQLITKPTA